MTSRISRSGFSLVEVTLALGIASFCLLAVIGLLPTGIAVNRNSTSDLAAATALQAVMADLRASILASKSTPLTTSRVFQIPLPLNGPSTVFIGEGGQQSGNTNQDANAAATPAPRYRITIYATPGSGRSATTVRLLATWPALADPTVAATPSKYSGSLEVLTAANVN